MQAVDLLMCQAAARPVVLRANSLVVGRVVLGVVVVVVMATAKHARCIAPPVQAVATRPRFLSSHKMTGLCIAAIVIRHKIPLIEVLAGRVGNFDEYYLPESW